MTETPGLGRINQVELREAWPHEANDFTPWLAEHITELGDALGLEIELQEQEASVGSFSLDLLARESVTDRTVIIENQLEPTNHDHLGKLLTYAGGSEANVIVWVAKNFRDEHRQAIDWLNQRTDDDTKFFGVAVELWKIGDSLPAPHFNVVSAPNEWQRETKHSVQDANKSERNRRLSGFFSRNSQTRSQSGDSQTRIRRGPKVGSRSRRDTGRACYTAPSSAMRAWPESRSTSATRTGSGTKTCTTNSLYKKYPSNPNSRNPSTGSGWTMEQRAACSACTKAVSKTTKRRWMNSKLDD